MTLLRCGLVIALALGGASGCAIGAPDRASDIQNVHAISDDISAVTMTHTEGFRARDPNIPTTLPNPSSVADTP